MIRIFTSKTQSFGEKGELEAGSFLRKRGFKVIERNVSNKFGEIDIVARKGHTYYFFEVKTGKVGATITPAENFHKEKLRKFFKSVEHYCFTRNIRDYRVHGIMIIFERDANKPKNIEIIDLF